MLQIFGQIGVPQELQNFNSVEEGGVGQFLNIILNILVIGAGIYAVVNLVLAGYSFMSAGDEPKKIEGAWSKIWQTLLGLAFAAGSFVLAAIFGKLIFGRYDAILFPRIPAL